MKRLLLILAMSCLAVPVVAAEPEAPESIQIKIRMDEARVALDDAAQRLAEVSREAYQVEYGQRSKKPVIGVLLAGKGDANGLLLEGVTPDGGAVAAGLQAGDRLIAINGERLDGEGEKPLKRLSNVLEDTEVGEVVQLEYVRDDTTYLADVVTQGRSSHVVKMLGGLDGFEIELSKLGEQLGNFTQIEEMAELSALSALKNLDGLHIEINDGHQMIAIGGDRVHLVDVDEGLGDYFGVDSGVLVVSSSDESNLESGDILLEVAGVEVNDVSEAYRALGDAEGKVEAKVQRKKRVRTIEIAASEFSQVRHLGMSHGPLKRVIRIERHGKDDVDVRVIVEDAD